MGLLRGLEESCILVSAAYQPKNRHRLRFTRVDMSAKTGGTKSVAMQSSKAFQARFQVSHRAIGCLRRRQQIQVEGLTARLKGLDG